MAHEAIIKVKNAEEKAAEIITEAKKTARKLIQEAEKIAEEKYREILTSAQTEARRIREDALGESEVEIKAIREQGQKTATLIRELDHKKLEPVVEHIIERIVNKNGHR